VSVAAGVPCRSSRPQSDASVGRRPGGADDSRPTEGKRLRVAGWLLAAASVALAAVAGVEFRSLGDVSQIDVPLSRAEIVAQDEVICGYLAKGLPPRGLHWDGEPARACLVDMATGRTLAPALMQQSTLSLNRRGVLWTEKEGCRFTIDRPTFDSAEQRLAIRFEQVPSRRAFYVYGLLAMAIFSAAILCGQIRRVRIAPPDRRRRQLFAELRLSTFLLLAQVSFFAFYPGSPVSQMSSDRANINGFAAGANSPETFAGDAFLCDPVNFDWYTPAFVYGVQAFGRMGFHYDTNRALLAFFCTLVGLFGYYRLFRTISGSELFAHTAALGLWFFRASYPPVENWAPTVIIPRTVYAALLPWVLLLALRYLRRPNRWWIPAAASALLFYVHPVSSPALTGAILTGAVVAGRGRPLKRLGWGVVGAAAALATMLPYTLIWMSKYSGTVVDGTTTATVYEFAREYLNPGFLDLSVCVGQMASYLVEHARFWPGMAAVVWLVAYRRHRRPVRLLGGMALGFGIVMLAVPAVDFTVSARLGRLPFQVDLVRNFRYVDVFLLATLGVALREIRLAMGPPQWPLAVRLTWGRLASVGQCRLSGPLVATVLIIVVFYGGACFRSLRKLGRRCDENYALLRGEPEGDFVDDFEMLRALQSVRMPHEVVSGPLYLRQAHVPLAFLHKDLGPLLYANPDAFLRCRATLDRAEEHLTWPITSSKAVAAAEAMQVDLLVLRREQVAPSLARSDAVIFQNATTVLVRIDRTEDAQRGAACGLAVSRRTLLSRKRQQ